MNLSEETVVRLEDLDRNPSTGINELAALLRQRLIQLKKFYIFIDALDELEPRERHYLVDLLAHLGLSTPSLKVFLAGRESLREELKKKLPGIERLSMASAEASADIALYIKEALNERIENGELVVGDPSLVSDIEEALTNHADGM